MACNQFTRLLESSEDSVHVSVLLRHFERNKKEPHSTLKHSNKLYTNTLKGLIDLEHSFIGKILFSLHVLWVNNRNQVAELVGFVNNLWF